MRILLTAFACHPEQGSEPGNGWGWARALAARGHEVELITRSEGVPAIERGRAELGLRGLRVHPVVPRTVPVPHAEARRLLGYDAWLRDCGRYAQRLPAPDVVHHVTWGSLHFGPYSDRLGAPLVTGPVGGGQVADPRHRAWFGEHWRDEHVRNVLTRRATGLFPGAHRVARSAHVFATNRATEQALRRLGAASVSLLLAEGIDPGWLGAAPRPARPGPEFVWVGSMVPRKAPGLALAAFARVAARLPAARLVLIGDGPGLPALRAQVAELGLGDRVDLPGRVPWPRIPARLDQADCFVFSSLRDSSSAQCLEAAARGLPIVALDQDGIRDLLPPGAVSLAGTDTDDLAGTLAAAMERAVDDPAERERAGAEALAWAAEQTWDRKAAAAETVYEALAR